MGMAARDKWKRRLEEEELVDRISGLPDAVLGEIVTLLPTRAGARTQVLSSRWRHIWRSAPLNFDPASDNPFDPTSDKPHVIGDDIPNGEISRILSEHRGPGRRFCAEFPYVDLRFRSAATLGGLLRSPALDSLQELEFHYGFRFPREWSPLPPPPPLPASVSRFSSTLRVARFGGCTFPDSALHLPVLKQLTLSHATISKSTLHQLLAGCPVLQSLLLSYNSGFSRVRIVSRTLTSIGVNPDGGESIRLQHLILEDAPCLERLLLFSPGTRKVMDISVISAPKLDILGPLSDDFSRVEIGSTVFQGPLVSFVTVMPSVKILALVNEHLSLDVAIKFLQCFSCLEKLYVKTTLAGYENRWCDKYENIVSTLDICVKKVVLLNYRGNKSHVNFAKLFVLSARLLESMVLELEHGIVLSTEWIERQHKRLHTKNSASRGAQFDFVDHDSLSGLSGYVNEAQAHDLSTADPFVRFRNWPS
ncbi:unnamed protein product [Urochloa decumbens]|uniref:F-box/LRR-repeat protein 15/At3g58940/PEG3-like LRR domain-containing protein n=1 Tax=Urochloa decumbens TaxID=240449 RepID=A0ABC9FL94_9POAL